RCVSVFSDCCGCACRLPTTIHYALLGATRVDQCHHVFPPLSRGFCFLCVVILCSFLCFFFFFSSRRRHTRLVSDWSSDVCSSDLIEVAAEQTEVFLAKAAHAPEFVLADPPRA